MTKRDYERAALIVQSVAQRKVAWRRCVEGITASFVELFAGDNHRFDEARFRAACVPGANVKARPKLA